MGPGSEEGLGPGVSVAASMPVARLLAVAFGRVAALTGTVVARGVAAWDVGSGADKLARATARWGREEVDDPAFLRQAADGWLTLWDPGRQVSYQADGCCQWEAVPEAGRAGR